MKEKKDSLKSMLNGQTDQDLLKIAEYYNININDIDFIDNIFADNIENGNYICNLDKGLVKGTHWVAFIKNNNEIGYFDSFGFRPPLILENYCKQNNLKCFFNLNQFQNINSSLCGLYCLLFLLIGSNMTFYNKKSFNDILDEMKFWSISP